MNDQIVEAIPFLCWHATNHWILVSPLGRDGRTSSYWHQETIVGRFLVYPVRDRGCLLPVLNVRDEVLRKMSNSFNTREIFELDSGRIPSQPRTASLGAVVCDCRDSADSDSRVPTPALQKGALSHRANCSSRHLKELTSCCS